MSCGRGERGAQHHVVEAVAAWGALPGVVAGACLELQALAEGSGEELTPVALRACGLLRPVQQPAGDFPAVVAVEAAVVVVVVDDEFGGGLAHSPALQLAETPLACGVELVATVGVWGAHRSAVGHLIKRRSRIYESVVVAFGAVVGLQSEAGRQYQAVDVEAVVFEVVVDL